jgi:hypothetical protein
VLAAGVVLALAAGFMVHAVVRATHEVPALSEDVRADNPPVAAVPPPAVSGWVPGAGATVEPDAAPAWSSGAFPVARANPYDVPGDPSTSMVGIAPRAPRERAAVARQRTFTNDDLLETRDSAWTRHAPAPEPPRGEVSGDPERSAEIAERETKLREKLDRLEAAERRLTTAGPDGRDDAADDLDDARRDAAKAERKLEEARRNN